MYSCSTTVVPVHALSPEDPRPRGFPVKIPLPEEAPVTARVDLYSDRLRCDHPRAHNGEALGLALVAEAEEQRRGRIVVLASEEVSEGLEAVGYETEAVMPGFYRGEDDCAVLAYALDGERSDGGHPLEVARVDALIERGPRPGRTHLPVETHRATPADAPEIAELIAETFEQYPTPSGNPEYIAGAIEEGTPFRVVRDQGEVVACASADLIREARTAELTDCATLPEARGRGYLQAILEDLMGDLRDLDYPTAFTLARARIAGVNLAFQRLDFEYRGRMTRSCRIGEGLEDMNVWSRSL
ncbi:MAG: GNAT family N-acetyltransferase [Deltaproteobacteria bacterium]|nr:GNAT family N-acetyltransferase [Deltaproteobacteria bacterium]